MAGGGTRIRGSSDARTFSDRGPAPEAGGFVTSQLAYYGKGQGAKYNDIVKANTPPVKNPDLILPGWVLRIPPQA